MTAVPAFISAIILMVVGHPVPTTCSTQAEWEADPVVMAAPFGIDAYTHWPSWDVPADSIHLGPATCARHDGIGTLQVLLEAEHATHVVTPDTINDETGDMCNALGWLRYTLRRDPVTAPASMWYEQQALAYWQSTPADRYRSHDCWPPVGFMAFYRSTHSHA